MVSKTRKQRQHRSEVLRNNGGILPAVVPSQPKSVHLKKTRPNMKSKQKVRLGLDSPIDIYTGFEDQKGVLWKCPTCQHESRVVGYCLPCATGVKATEHKGMLMSRSGGSGGVKKLAKKTTTASGKKTLKLKKKKSK